VIFTNQLRMKVGVLFGNPETTPGGRALKFYSSVRLDIRRVQSIKAGTEVIGNRTKVWVKKNKVAPPFRKAEFDIMYDEGISREGDLIDVAVEMGLLDKKGAYFSYGETKLAQGRENAKAFLRENPQLAQEISDKVRSAAGLAAVPWPVRKPSERSGSGEARLAEIEEPSTEPVEE
jgi:recombination protein RecA